MIHRRVRLWIAVWAALGSSNAAFAASFPVAGTLSIEISTLPPITVSGAGTALVNGSGGGGHLETLALPANVFQASGVVMPVTDLAASPIKGLQVTVANAAGTVTGGAGAIPLVGVAKICLFTPCSTAINNLNVPLSVIGAGGASFTTGAVNLTVVGMPWTTGTVAVGSFTRMGFAKGPGSNASSTGVASGQVQLVTPIFIATNIPASVVVPLFAVMTLHFVPEPGTIALLGTGLALLAAGGERLRNR